MGFVRIKDAGTNKERFHEPHVSKKVMNRIIAQHKQNAELMRLGYLERIQKLHEINQYSRNNENNLMKQVKVQKILIFISSGVSLVIGGGLGWLMN